MYIFLPFPIEASVQKEMSHISLRNQKGSAPT